ncbi:VanZ family protein [Frigoribacterium faeni]|uniref:VanZ family protein n=1 Tax=Frigoribacterium faeni TaxID=145483 RepID=UPI00141BE5E3|nr:VanZ family protein [Frigoribacterium faeni]NIJ04590.1 glycopeptide antibiotics resistance protein [Frigoribacterium faeni]
MAVASNAVIALVLGSVLAVVGLVPWAAVQYRRRGELGLGNALLAFAAVVYALALVTYTLLPLPGTTDAAVLCSPAPAPQLHPFEFVRDIAKEGGVTGPRSLLGNRAVAQVALNVALFVPLGMLVAHFTRGRTGSRRRRLAGVVAGTLAGAAISLLIELTQLTGDWFLFPCAYRLFDVDDLLANTAGALLGTAVAPVLLLLGRPGADPDRDDARPVTVRRRAFGMACDLLAILLTGGGLSSVVSIGLAVAERDPASGVGVVLLAAAPLVAPAAQLVLVLTTGRTLGEIVTRLRPEPRPSAGQRLVRWALGSGGWALASALSSTSAVAAAVAVVLAVGAVVGVWATRDRRGFANAVARLGVVDERT